jgi:hypothetical protein
MMKSRTAHILRLMALLLCITAEPSAAALDINLVYLGGEAPWGVVIDD